MVYMGTLVTGGQGTAIVVSTGKFTEIGQIQNLVGNVEPPKTPMERQLEKIGNQLVYICSGVCLIVFLIGLARGYNFLQMLKIAISLAVAAVPEGLPTVATTILAMGIKKMRQHNVLIRHLNAVETLGSVQTLCFDKTGTITFNKMAVAAVYAGGKHFKITQDGTFQNSSEFTEELFKLVEVCTLCNETAISVDNGQYILNGSSTENALIQIAVNTGVDVIELREKHPIVHIKHRTEQKQCMITQHTRDKSKIIAIKGSPLEVLKMCRLQLKDGQTIDLSEEDNYIIQKENEKMAGKALRVLGVAYDIRERGKSSDGLIWLGLVGMADPVRHGVKGLMQLFHTAGMDTVMITGDQSPTAYAIGKLILLSR
jgi:Ca2+-transporting ATPase